MTTSLPTLATLATLFSQVALCLAAGITGFAWGHAYRRTDDPLHTPPPSQTHKPTLESDKHMLSLGRAVAQCITTVRSHAKFLPPEDTILHTITIQRAGFKDVYVEVRTQPSDMFDTGE